MSFSHVWLSSFIVCLCASCVFSKPVSLEKTLDKYAGAALRSCPELRVPGKTGEIRESLVQKWMDQGAGSIEANELRVLKRRVRDYESFTWTQLLKRFHAANIEDALSQFLLKEAHAKTHKAEEFYVLGILLKARLEEVLEQREKALLERMRTIGLGYTSYIRKYGYEPVSILQCVRRPEDVCAICPETGTRKAWIYVGAGPAEIRGANRYRVVVFSPFASGSAKDKRRVVYKGGTLGEWNEQTMNKQIALMQIENMSIIRELEKQEEVENISSPAQSIAQKPTLRIEIRELW